MEKLNFKKPQFFRQGIGEHMPDGHGVSAYYIRIGETGMGYKLRKPGKIPPTIEEAKKDASALQGEYQKIKEYLDPYVPPTQFVIGRNEENEITIVGLQPEIKNGMSIKKALKKARKENLDIENIVDLYKKATNMYKATKNIPDFNGTGRFLGWTRPNSTRNVIVTIEDGKLIPHVVDVGFISGEPPIIRSLHPIILARSILREYGKIK